MEVLKNYKVIMNKSELLYQDLTKAVNRFQSALKEQSEDELIQAGCIQYFEFCFELAWKTIKALVQNELASLLFSKIMFQICI